LVFPYFAFGLLVWIFEHACAHPAIEIEKVIATGAGFVAYAVVAPLRIAFSLSFWLLFDRVGHEVGFKYYFIRRDALDSQFF
jgi:hypothetical protein